MPGTLCSCWLACTHWVQGRQACLAQMDRKTGLGQQICTWPAGKESLVLETSSHWVRSCTPSTSAAEGYQAEQAESKWQQRLSFRTHGGEGWGSWGTLACAFESSSCWCHAAHWCIRVRLSKGPQEYQSLPGHLQTPAHPAASSPSKDWDTYALLSAGLSPRAVASS